MKFITFVKTSEACGPPPKALMEAMATAGIEAVKAGTLLMTGGLGPSKMGALLRVSKGKLTVKDGPFTEAKEVIGGYAVLEVPSRAEAIEAARWLMQLHIDHWPGWEGETEVRPMFEDTQRFDGK